MRRDRQGKQYKNIGPIFTSTKLDHQENVKSSTIGEGHFDRLRFFLDNSKMSGDFSMKF